MNALLDYGTSSESEDESNDSSSSKDEPKASDKPKLPKPSLGENALQTSVFSNPFVAAERAKAAILEKHVKMSKTDFKVHKLNMTRKTYSPIMHIIVKYIVVDCKVPGKEDTQMINGKKICWNYRKGRCRFGHKCRYAHDSDIQKTPDELNEDKKKLNTVVCEGSGTMTATPPPAVLSPTDDEVWEGGSDKKRAKRLGLSQTLVPGKKVIKMYKEQRLRDSVKK